jgi:hypothetical protein
MLSFILNLSASNYGHIYGSFICIIAFLTSAFIFVLMDFYRRVEDKFVYRSVFM